jgi:dTDP-glucose 4,6-dehydratase
MKLLVTGGAGFIGGAFVRTTLAKPDATRLVVLDKLTYAGNLENLKPIDTDPRFRFVQGDICDGGLVGQLLHEESPDAIVHFAAESHVDRSIHAPTPVFDTNLKGTFTLLEAARAAKLPRFVHVSTDEVYGSIPAPHDADEDYPLRTSSPYSAAKAGSDLLALSYNTTYKLDVVVTRASNNYGPYHFPEKLIPLMICNAMEDKPLPVYGDGQQIRDWLYVEDHCDGIRAVLAKGRAGQVYNLSGNCSITNLEVVQRILRHLDKPESLIRYVTDRPGHDVRYALTSEKVERECGWRAAMNFDQGLAQTISWYQDNFDGWVARVRSGDYRNFYQLNYSSR